MEVPELTREMEIKLEILFELFFKQLMTFADYINEFPDKISNEKYADCVLFCMNKRLQSYIKDEKQKKRKIMPKKQHKEEMHHEEHHEKHKKSHSKVAVKAKVGKKGDGKSHKK